MFRSPHRFELVIGTTTPKPPVLLIGAGMSYSLVPQVPELLARMVPKQADIEDALGVSRCAPLDAKVPNDLYRWAGEVVEKLVANGYSEVQSKRKLAEHLGLTSDPCWAARSKIPVRGTSPRHRVIARLAREGKWHALWSLNWDVWLERALESVGIEPVEKSASVPAPLPKRWVRWYETWEPSKPDTGHGDSRTITVFKPHGCVASLLRDEGVIVLTETELEGKLAKLPAITNRLSGDLAKHSLVAAGWRAGEPYLVNLIASVPDRERHCSLTIIDPFPNPNGHLALATAYGVPQSSMMCEPRTDKFPRTDDAFLWVQARHGLSCLLGVGLTAWDGDCLATALAMLAEPNDGEGAYLSDWFDNFLPVWCRLCFSSGRQRFRAGLEVGTDAIPTHKRDEHVPWNYDDTDRLDLRAAGRLLAALCRKLPCKWKFDAFPGALWNSETHALVIPVPSWDSREPQSLQALKPLVESRHWANQGLIRSISLMALNADSSSAAVDAGSMENWRYEVARLMHFSHFANPSNINWETLETWEALP